MTAVVLALVASVSYGVSDFFGGLAARRRGTVTATLAVYAGATVVVLAALVVLPWHVSEGAVASGVVAGILAIVGFLAFYAALAIGPMSVLSPTIALVNTVVPVAAAVVLGESLGPLGWLGVAIALAAGVLVSLEPRAGVRVDPRGLVLALVAGLLLGGSIVALDSAPAGAGILPGVIDTTIGLLVLAPIALLIRRSDRPAIRALDAPESDVPLTRGRFLAASLTGGGLLGASNLLIVLALQSGELAIVSVLISLYPVVTVVLAAGLLRERLAPVQILGVLAALAAAALLALS